VLNSRSSWVYRFGGVQLIFLTNTTLSEHPNL
jgi:hypothetical protein